MLVVHHLEDSRSQRILWLLEELETPYEIVHHTRDPQTRFASAELLKIHPLGKSPVITDNGRTIGESGAIIEYILRTYGKGALQLPPDHPEYDAYVEWLHYAEGSAMQPMVLKNYVDRLGEAGAPLRARIEGEVNRQFSYIDNSLKGRDFLVGGKLTGADINVGFLGKMAGLFGKLSAYPNFAAWIERLQSRPAFLRSVEKGGPYLMSKP